MLTKKVDESVNSVSTEGNAKGKSNKKSEVSKDKKGMEHAPVTKTSASKELLMDKNTIVNLQDIHKK